MNAAQRRRRRNKGYDEGPILHSFFLKFEGSIVAKHYHHEFSPIDLKQQAMILIEQHRLKKEKFHDTIFEVRYSYKHGDIKKIEQFKFNSFKINLGYYELERI